MWAENVEELTKFLDGVAGSVEANSYEQHFLWIEYEKMLNWESRREGYVVFCGELAGESVCMSLTTSVINGQKILFYDTTSRVVDHRLIDAWRAKWLPNIPNTNAMNFHNVLHR